MISVIADYLQLSDRSYQSDELRICRGVQREFHHFTNDRKIRYTAPPEIGGLNTNGVDEPCAAVKRGPAPAAKCHFWMIQFTSAKNRKRPPWVADGARAGGGTLHESSIVHIAAKSLCFS
jgi:hypothetical protein